MTPRSALILVGAVMALGLPAAAQSPDLTSLHDALHLTPVQEAAWRNYRQAIAPSPEAQARQKAAEALIPTLPTPRRIDLINAEMEANVSMMRRQGEAVKTFYATLTPSQQHIFDSQTLPRPGQGPGGD